MSAPAKGTKVPALKLTVGGAPSGWHQLPDTLPGLYHPDIPTPVGGEGDLCSLEQAKAFVDRFKDQSEQQAAWDAFEAAQEENGFREHGRIPFEPAPCPLELVQITQAQAEEAREEVAVALGASRRAVRAARHQAKQDKDEGLAVQARDEQAAVSGQEG